MFYLVKNCSAIDFSFLDFVKLTVTVALTIKVRNGYFNFFPLKLIIFLCTSIVEAILKIKLYVKAH